MKEKGDESLSASRLDPLSAFLRFLFPGGPWPGCGAWRGRDGPSTKMAEEAFCAGRSRVKDKPTSSLECCLPAASNKQSKPTFPIPLPCKGA